MVDNILILLFNSPSAIPTFNRMKYGRKGRMILAVLANPLTTAVTSDLASISKSLFIILLSH